MDNKQSLPKRMEQSQIAQWENELNRHGCVRNEGELLQYIKKHDLHCEKTARWLHKF